MRVTVHLSRQISRLGQLVCQSHECMYGSAAPGNLALGMCAAKYVRLLARVQRTSISTAPHNAVLPHERSKSEEALEGARASNESQTAKPRYGIFKRALSIHKHCPYKERVVRILTIFARVVRERKGGK
jgi:hypothetical protein